MKNEDIQKLTETINEKLGKDSAGLIADDLATIISDTIATNKLLDEKENTINELNTRNQNLLSVNGNLLQRVSMGQEDPFVRENKENEEKPKFVDYKLGFDEFGNFKK